jgi:hypothetical protein
LKALREAEDAEEMAETTMADKNNNNDGTLEAVNGMIGGVIDEGAAQRIVIKNLTLLLCVYYAIFLNPHT